jgi:hypothetical protein
LPWSVWMSVCFNMSKIGNGFVYVVCILCCLYCYLVYIYLF